MGERNDFASAVLISKRLSERLAIQSQEVAALKSKVSELELSLQEKERNIEDSMLEKLELMSSVHALNEKLADSEQEKVKIEKEVAKIEDEKKKFDRKIIEECSAIVSELRAIIESGNKIVEDAITKVKETSKSRRSFLDSLHDTLLCAGFIESNEAFDEDGVTDAITRLCSKMNVMNQIAQIEVEKSEQEKEEMKAKLLSRKTNIVNHVFYNKCLIEQFNSAIFNINRLTIEAQHVYNTNTSELMKRLDEQTKKVNDMKKETVKYNECMEDNCKRVNELEKMFVDRINELEKSLKEEKEKNRKLSHNSTMLESLMTIVSAKTNADLIVNVSSMKRKVAKAMQEKEELLKVNELLKFRQASEQKLSERNKTLKENNELLKAKIEELEAALNKKEDNKQDKTHVSQTSFLPVLQFLTQLQISSSNIALTKIVSETISRIQTAIASPDVTNEEIEQNMSNQLIALAAELCKLCSEKQIEILKPKARTYATKSLFVDHIIPNPRDFD